MVGGTGAPAGVNMSGSGRLVHAHRPRFTDSIRRCRTAA
jgi:hypothetical protein